MRDFERRTRLTALSRPTRVVYSVFLLFTLAAVAVSAWLAEVMVGLDLASLDEYYAGIPPAATQSAPATRAGGPELVLPEADGPELALAQSDQPVFTPEPKSLRATLEVTHFHLFIMPLQWLVLAHLFALGGWPERAKLWLLATSAAAVAGHIAAPWVARSAPVWSAAFYAVTGLGLGVTFVVMTVVPLAEMWLPRRSRPLASGSGTR